MKIPPDHPDEKIVGDLVRKATANEAKRPLSPERLSEIRERAEKATPGPWRSIEDGIEGRHVECEPDTLAASFLTAEDADFIAAARQDVPDLLAEVERIGRVALRFASYPCVLEPPCPPVGKGVACIDCLRRAQLRADIRGEA